MFFSLSTSVRRSDFSFNSLRLDDVSSKTTTSTSPSTLRFRTAYFYASGSEDPLNIIGQHSLGLEKRKHSIRGSAFKWPCTYTSTSLSVSHPFIQRRCLTPQNQDPPQTHPPSQYFSVHESLGGSQMMGDGNEGGQLETDSLLMMTRYASRFVSQRTLTDRTL